MQVFELSLGDITALTSLANGIIPADEHDAGAAMVHAGLFVSERARRGGNAAIYEEGLRIARSLAQQDFAREIGHLTPTEIDALLHAVSEQAPLFFKQLRMDVSAAYLSDPGVWQRIGFPGPSTISGGYPDFDQPQTAQITVAEKMRDS